jgi:hypothetical protein
MNASQDTQLGGFETRLLSELRSAFDTQVNTAPRRRTHRRVVYGAAAIAAAAACAAAGAGAWQIARDPGKVERAQLPRGQHVGEPVAAAGDSTLYVAPNGVDWELESSDMRAQGRFEAGSTSASVSEGATGALVFGVIRGAGDTPVEVRMPGRAAVVGRAHNGYFLVSLVEPPPRGSTVVARGTGLTPVSVDLP